MNKYLYLLFLLLFSSNIAFAEVNLKCYYKDNGNEFYEHLVDYDYVKANVSFEPEHNKIIAKVSMNFRKLRENVDSLVLYAPNFLINKVTIDDKEAKYYFQDKNLIVKIPFKLEFNKTYVLFLDYTVQNYTGEIYFVGFDDTTGRKRKQIWAHRPHGWLPFADARVKVDMYLTFDSKYKIYSNGVRKSIIKNGDGTNTYWYQMDKSHPYFSTALAIGDYDYKTLKTKSGLEEELWYYPEQAYKFETTYRYSTDMIDFYEKEFGVSYPWKLYRQVPLEDYLYGAMETTTSTVYGDFLLVDTAAYFQRNYINVNAHELAHQWFGNDIAHISNRDVCLTESFATYFAKIFEKAFFGKDYYDWERVQEYDKAMSADEKNNYPIGCSFSGSERIYQKGSLCLDMLRNSLGDDDFKRVIRFYAETYPAHQVAIEDFLYSIYKVTGLDYHWFFDEWIYRGGYPYYQIDYSQVIENQKKILQLHLKQIQKTDETVHTFKMPLDIDIYYKDGTKETRNFKNEEKEQIYHFLIPEIKDVDFVVFDPDRKVFKKVKYLRDFAETARQAEFAANLLDRYDAVKDLADEMYGNKKELYQRIFQKETFHLIKAEIIKQIANEKDKIALKIFKDAINSKDELVIQSLVENVKIVPVELKNDYERIVQGLCVSNINIEKGLENLCSSFPENIQKYLELTKDKEGWRGKNIKIKWLEIAYNYAQKSNNSDELNNILKQIIDYSSNSYNFETRINSLQLLQRLNYLDKEAAYNLILADTYWHYKLRNAANDVFNYFIQQNEKRKMLLHVLTANNWSEPQTKAIEGLIKKINNIN